MAANLKYTANEQKFVESMKKMAGSVGQLAANVNLKLNKSFKESDYLSRKLDQGFGKLGGQMKSFGRAMTIGVTLPLALAAKSASDAFAEYDSLRRALASYHPTLDGLNSRLAEMRTLAKLPGLGFQEAIQGDVRLQAVGISAKNSSKILREFANAIAQTGGGKAQLNEVTIQLGQMAAKGKVLNQDLRPIIESAPAVATALKSIFGTVSSEDISNKLTAAGKTSTEFIEILLVEMAKAPRVTGGWKNSLENLSDALFISKSRIFEVANEVFGLEGKVNSFSDTLERMVDGFTSLSPVLQGAILAVTGLLTVMGPLSWGVGSLVTLLPKLLTAVHFTTLAIGGLTLGIGALIAAVVIAVGEVSSYNEMIKESSNISNRAASETKKEVLVMEGYIKTLNSSSASVDRTKIAKEELRKLSPEFTSALKNEKIDFDKLGGAVSNYKDQLLLASKQKQDGLLLDSLIKRQQESEKGNIGIWPATKVVGNTVFDNLRDDKIFSTTPMQVWLEASVNVTKKAGEQWNELGVAIAKVTERMEGRLGDLQEEGTGTAPPFGPSLLEAAAEEERKTLETHVKNIEDFAIRRRKAMDAMAELLSPQDIAIEPIDRKEKEAKEVETLSDSYMFKISNKSTLTLYDEALMDLQRFKDDANAIWAGIGGDFVANFAQGLASGKGIKGALKGLISDLGGLMIEYGKTALKAVLALKAFDTMFKINPASNGAMIKALGLIAAGGTMKGFASGIPALAQGGVTSNPTLAMIGDNSSGKEMVMPWEKTGDFASKIASDLGGGIGGGSMNSVLRGEDIYFSLERYKRGNN
jgi:tape measure domain-containing protein